MAKKNIEAYIRHYTPHITFTSIILALLILITQYTTNYNLLKSFHPVLITTTIILSLTVLAVFLLKEKT